MREEEDQSRRYSPQEVFQQHRFCQDHGFVCEMKGKGDGTCVLVVSISLC